MKTLDISHLINISLPVMNRFSDVEPQKWDRKVLLLELLGEIGSLAHLVQRWNRFKQGRRPTLSELGDECSDILFIVLRLAREDGVHLPSEIEIQNQNSDAADLVLNLCTCFTMLLANPSSTADELTRVLQSLSCLANLLGVDLVKAHESEMEIALGFFCASGDTWPRVQPLRHPIAAFNLWRRLWKRRRK